MSGGSFAILLQEDVPFDVREVSRIVARILRVPRADASIRVRKARGTLLSGLEEPAARELQEALAGLSIATVLLPEAARVRPAGPKRVAYAELDESAIYVGSPYEKERTVPVP